MVLGYKSLIIITFSSFLDKKYAIEHFGYKSRISGFLPKLNGESCGTATTFSNIYGN
jgi:hypothetical protein